MKVFYKQFYKADDAMAWINISIKPYDVISIYETSGYARPVFVWYKSETEK
jgi:hypothetical protein